MYWPPLSLWFSLLHPHLFGSRSRLCRAVRRVLIFGAWLVTVQL